MMNWDCLRTNYIVLAIDAPARDTLTGSSRGPWFPASVRW